MHAQGTDHTAEFGTCASVRKLELYKFVHVCETAKYDKTNGHKLQKDDLKLRQSQTETFEIQIKGKTYLSKRPLYFYC